MEDKNEEKKKRLKNVLTVAKNQKKDTGVLILGVNVNDGARMKMVSDNKPLKIFVFDTIDLGGIKKKTFRSNREELPFMREIFNVVKVLLDNNALSRPPTFNNIFWLYKAG